MKNLLILLFFIYSTVSFAFQGILLERGTKKPLEGVNVFILPQKIKAITDKGGNFSFTEKIEGNFKIIVNATGYIRLEKKFEKIDDKLTLYLEKQFYETFETTVTGLASKRESNSITLTQKQFIKAPGAQEDPVKAVANLPGVARNSNAQVVIQGSEPDDTAYALNGHEIPLIFHFGGLSSVMFPQSISSVNYLSAGYGPEFGKAIGGLVTLDTKSPKADRYHGMAYLDIFNVGAYVEGPISEKQSLFLSARKSYVGEVLSKVAEENENFDFTVAPSFTDANLIYNYQINKNEFFKLTSVTSKDTLEFVLNEPVGNDPAIRGDFYQVTKFYRIIPEYHKKINNKHSVMASIGYGADQIDVELSNYYFNIDSRVLTTRAELITRQSKKWKTFVGIDNKVNWYNVKAGFPSVYSQGGINNPISSGEDRETSSIGDYEDYAAYFRNEIKIPKSKWILGPNIRIDKFGLGDNTVVSPRLHAKYLSNDSLYYHVSWGHYYQPGQPGEYSSEYGNPDLVPEKATHYALGLSKDFRKSSSNGIVIKPTVFYKKLENLIIDTTETDDGESLNKSNDGEGKIYGLESLITYNYDQFSTTISYTYLKSVRTEPDIEEHPSEYDQTHNFNLICSYEKSRWSYSTRLRYVTGNPYTPITTSYYDSDGDVYVPKRGELYSKRYEPFFQLDFRIDRKWVYNTWILSSYLDIQNITNNKNPQSINYNYDYSEETTTNGLPILPIFGVKGEF